MKIFSNPVKQFIIEFKSGESYELEVKDNDDVEVNLNISENNLDLNIHSYEGLIVRKI
jgi:uncharacterized protein YkvS